MHRYPPPLPQDLFRISTMFLAPLLPLFLSFSLSLIDPRPGRYRRRGSFGGVINVNHRVPSKNHDAMLLRDRRLSLARTTCFLATYASNACSNEDVAHTTTDIWIEIGPVGRGREFNDDSIDVSIQYACNLRKKSSDASAPESRARYTHRSILLYHQARHSWGYQPVPIQFPLVGLSSEHGVTRICGT